MLYLPSSRIWDLMKVESSGVWLDRSSSAPNLWMVAKLPMHMIRAVNAGAAVWLHVWVVEIDKKRIAAFGLQVHDDPQHPSVFYGACRSAEEIKDLRAIVAGAFFPLQVHNEVFLPVFHADCVIAPELASPVLDLLPPAEDRSEPEGRQLRARALDVVQASLVPGATADGRMRAHCELPLTFERIQSLRSFVAGSGLVSLDDNDEGNELERLAFQAFEFLCPSGTYHQPQLEHAGNRRELCDILAVSRIREHKEEGIFVVQSKVASVTPDGLARTTQRRAVSIQKNIVTAISQLKGAIKRLRAGDPVFRADGTPIEADPLLPELAGVIEPLNLRERANNIGHGIVLVSDMHEDVDWREVARELFAAVKSTEYLMHILDLRELQRLVSYSHGRPAVFEAHLVGRWELMVQEENAFVRSHFLP